MMEGILERLKRGEVLLSDGAMGTMLLERGLKAGACPESFNLSHPEVLQEVARLYLEAGAVLLGSTDLRDYAVHTPAFRSYTDVNYVDRSLIYAEKVRNIAILGRGTIDGQGGARSFERKPYRQRPYLIRMIECEDVVIRDITLRDSPMWVQHYW